MMRRVRPLLIATVPLPLSRPARLHRGQAPLNRALRLGLSVLLAGAAGLASVQAQAKNEPIAILPFTGLHGDEPQSAVVHMLRKRAAVVAAADIGQSTATVLLNGEVQTKGGRADLVITALLLKTGTPSGTLTYPIHNRHLTHEQLKQIAIDVNELTRKALGQAGTETESAQTAEESDAAAEEAAQGVAQSEDTEKVQLVDVPVEQTGRRFPPRPRWAPLVDVSAGLVFATRSEHFKPAQLPTFKAGTGVGLHGDLTLYPLAFLHAKYHGVLGGLGAGVTVDKPFWTKTEQEVSGLKFHTNEFRIEGGLRWRFEIRTKLPRFELTALAGAGLHTFSVGFLRDGNVISDGGPPRVTYIFGAFGLQARMHFTEWASVWAAFSYEYVPDAGHIEDLNEYGLANIWGYHVRGGLDFYVWKKLKVGGSAYLEQFDSSFVANQKPTPLKHASSFDDKFYGGTVSVGYTY